MKRVIAIIVLSIIFVQCNSDKKFLITKNGLGNIEKNTTITELDDIFENDSVVKFPENVEVLNKYSVYSQEGNQIVEIKLHVVNDSVAGIEHIKIFDKSYKTEKGLSTLSTFKDIVDNYSISKIQPTFSSAVVFIDEINATAALDKKDLRLGEFDMKDINKDQVPDMAKIKYITLWFD
ncbi:MAG: hypothetical protein OEM04_09455 [Flavobacteriaceae bacterium]|nr:hypothetical protein [Flavobacteriaceae bacterium]